MDAKVTGHKNQPPIHAVLKAQTMHTRSFPENFRFTLKTQI
jgi:hypothetical protein